MTASILGLAVTTPQPLNPIALTMSAISAISNTGSVVLTALSQDPPDGNFTEVLVAQPLNLTIPGLSAVDIALITDMYGLEQDLLVMHTAAERFQGAELAGDDASQALQDAAFNAGQTQYAIDRAAVGADLAAFKLEMIAQSVPDATMDGSDLAGLKAHLADVGLADPFFVGLINNLTPLLGADEATADAQATLDAILALQTPAPGGSAFAALDAAAAALSHDVIKPAAHDFDANHHSDILWHNDSGATSIWDDGVIGGAHIIAAAGVVPVGWHIAGKGDFDGNGQGDILWRNDNGAASIWDDGAIANAHIISAAGVVPNSWHISGTGDFDGNGHGDILWRNDNGAASIWDNGQIANAHIISDPGVVPNSWHIAGTGDFDGNGHDDILWRNDNGAVSIWDDGQIVNAHIISDAGVVPNSWHISGTGDFDGNGHSDILWRNDNGAVSIWDDGQIGGAHIVSAAGVVPNSWHISDTGDFDGNGQSDILWRNDNGAASIWDNGEINHAHIIADAGVIPNGWHIV